MSEVLVRNLDECVVEQLKARARVNGRSLQADETDLDRSLRRRQAVACGNCALADRATAPALGETGSRPTARGRCWPRTMCAAVAAGE